MHTIADIIPKDGNPIESGADDSSVEGTTPPLSTGLSSPLVQTVTEATQPSITAPTAAPAAAPTIPLQTTLPTTMADPALIKQALLLRHAVEVRQQLLHPLLRNYQNMNSQLPGSQLPRVSDFIL